MTEDPGDITVSFPFHFQTGSRGRKQLRTGEKVETIEIPLGRTPRVARLMALAIHFDGLIRAGEVSDFAEIARFGLVTRARITQIMNLLLLAPDIQDELLQLPMTVLGKDFVTEKGLRRIVGRVDWSEQRRRWRKICADVQTDLPAPCASHATSTSGS